MPANLTPAAYPRLLLLALLLSACREQDAPRADASLEHQDPDSQDPDSQDPDSQDPDSQDPDPNGTDRRTYEDTETVVSLTLRASDLAERNSLEAQISALQGLSGADLIERRGVTFSNTLGYTPLEARGLDLIQASELRLNSAELSKLSEQGFAVIPRTAFTNMSQGLVSIYAADLPVYVSLDSILDAVHLSYDAILKDIETTQLIPALRSMLSDARARLSGAALSEEVAADLDVYFTLALSLLVPEPVACLNPENEAIVKTLLARAMSASDIIEVPLFGARRAFDFSQFKPRGHYTDTEELKRYFRTMIWLGRTDFRLIETLPDGRSVFRRRQFEAVLALSSLIQGEGRKAYDQIDAVVSAFVGEHDYMALPEISPLLAVLGDVDSLDDQTIAQNIVDSGYGAQRIASQVIYRTGDVNQTYPIGRSFALLGQRFVVDSQVFSNVVWGRVTPSKGERRFLPNGLDVAYAALGNNGALPLLSDELTRYDYAPHLEAQRIGIDAHGDAFWNQNLYNIWLSALRAVSPRVGPLDPSALGQPSVTGSEAWNRRLLNTQLGSWAELRHDTILYAKQSYTDGAVCEFPDGYVDPYPEAFARIVAFAEKGIVLSDALGSTVSDRARLYFAELAQVAAMLRRIAEQQASGVPLDAAQLSFLNDAVRSQLQGCGGPELYTGWYARLLYNKSAADMDPTIADVHTDPGGDHPAQVLYAATGLPRLMVVTRETCTGPRAYAGVVFTYHEFALGLPRLDDIGWSEIVHEAQDPAFMQPILP